MSKPTTGPWVTSRDGRTITSTGTVTPTRVADVFGEPCRLANARLIAAAPDMLAALNAVRETTIGINPHFPNAIACKVMDAIAKAEATS